MMKKYSYTKPSSYLVTHSSFPLLCVIVISLPYFYLPLLFVLFRGSNDLCGGHFRSLRQVLYTIVGTNVYFGHTVVIDP